MGTFLFVLIFALLAFGAGIWWAHRNVDMLTEASPGQVNLWMWGITIASVVLSLFGIFLQFQDAKPLGQILGLPPIMAMAFVFGVIKYYTDLPDPEPSKEEPLQPAPPPIPSRSSVEDRLSQILDKNKR